MNTKSIFAMLGILALGFALGFLTAGHFAKKRVNHIRKFGTAKGFQERFFNMVKLDEAQKQKLMPTLKTYSDKFQQIHSNFKNTRSALLDSLQQNIEGELTESQKEGLKKFVKKLKKPPRSKKRKKEKKKKKE